MECAAAPVDGVEYPLVLGPTLLGASPSSSATQVTAGGATEPQQFYALHFNFKPTSIDTSRPGALRHGGPGKVAGPGGGRLSSGGGGVAGSGSSRVFFQLANNQAGKADVEFEGQEDAVRELDCVLLFDGRCVRLERLHHSVRLTHRTDKQAQSGAGAGAGSHQPAHQALALSQAQGHHPHGASGAEASAAQGPAPTPAAAASSASANAAHPSRLSPFNDPSAVTDGRVSPLLSASAAAVSSLRRGEDASVSRPGPRRSPLPSRPLNRDDRGAPESISALLGGTGAGARHSLPGREEGAEGKGAPLRKRPSQEAEAALRGTSSGAHPLRGSGPGPAEGSAGEAQRRRSAEGSQASPSQARAGASSSVAAGRDPSLAAAAQASRGPGTQGASPSKLGGADAREAGPRGKRQKAGNGAEPRHEGQGVLAGRAAERTETCAGAREEIEVGQETDTRGEGGGGSQGPGAGCPAGAETLGEEEVEVVVEEVIGEEGEEGEEEVVEYEEIVVEEDEEEEEEKEHYVVDIGEGTGMGVGGRPEHAVSVARGSSGFRQSEGIGTAEGRGNPSEGSSGGAGAHSHRRASGDDAGSGSTALDGDRRASAMVEVGLNSSDESGSSKDLSGSDDSSSSNESDDEEEDEESVTSGSDI